MKWIVAPLIAGGLVAGAIAVAALNAGTPAIETGQRTIVMGEMRFSPNRLVTLRFDKAGTYNFLCTIPGHATAGMTGAVYVNP